MSAARTSGLVLAVVTAVSATACSDRSRPELGGDDAGIRPRVFEPPPSRVRAAPPHNIHAEGIGPYQLGASLGDILNLLPHGPRVELFRLGSVADYSLVRSENGALLVGVERGDGVTFVAAIAPVVARTEGGAEVGTLRDALLAELGTTPAPGGVREARLVRSSRLPGALFLIDRGQIAAIVVDRKAATPPEGAAKPASAPAPATCALGDLGDLGAEIADAARLGAAATIEVSCSGREVTGAVVSRGDRWVWLAVAGDKVRRVAAGSIDGLKLAAPATISDTPVLIAVSEERSSDQLQVKLEVSRLDKTPTQLLERATLYRLSSTDMRLAGGTIGRAMIAVEIELLGDGLVARGLYAHRDRSGELAVVAPLTRRPIDLSRPRRSRPQPDAGPPDLPAADAGPRRAIGRP